MWVATEQAYISQVPQPTFKSGGDPVKPVFDRAEQGWLGDGHFPGVVPSRDSQQGTTSCVQKSRAMQHTAE